jgi:hypothetical protein
MLSGASVSPSGGVAVGSCQAKTVVVRRKRGRVSPRGRKVSFETPLKDIF